MVCVTVFVNVFDPSCEHLLYEFRIAHACEIVHGSEDVLYLSEADLTVALLCPVKRSGYECLVEDLERKVVVYISFEVLILVLDLHVAGILAREVDYILKVLCEVVGILDVVGDCLCFFGRCLINYIVLIYAVRRKACDAVNADSAVCLYRERCGCGKESGSLS